jgi:uncharacterized membrane protein YqiK
MNVGTILLAQVFHSGVLTGLAVVACLMLLSAVPFLLGVRRIPTNMVGVVEKFWSARGSVGEGRMIALNGEAGYQPELLRGGLHFGYWPWQYRVYKAPLTIVPQGKIGYIFARDGEALLPQQTLGRVTPCNNFQNARDFLSGSKDHAPGQRGRQRAILREGVYAINLALFVVVTEERVYCLEAHNRQEATTVNRFRQELLVNSGFDPVVVGANSQPHGAGEESLNAKVAVGCEASEVTTRAGDTIGIVTVHDGPALAPGQIIAPPVATDPENTHYHANFQDIEAFLAAGGRRGRQYITLTDGTYFINRWFATVELIPKTVVPIGHVGVVVSYYGKEQGFDLSGEAFRHGERVSEGERGVQAKTLGPGKYAFNTYAGHVHLVPTTNFVLHWITGRTETHRYDESLKSIDLVTADAYEPMLPLSVVVHIDYQKAASVVQRFGDVKKLITQTLDPLLSAYFRDIAHKKTMLALLHDRDEIQTEARNELRLKFADFDIELVDVLIGKPDTAEASGEIETLLEQLRLRQLSREQVQTYQEQCLASEKLKMLKLAQAHAEKQTELTNSQVEIEIARNQGEAELARGRKRAEQTVVDAEAERSCRLLVAEAESKSKLMFGEAEAKSKLMLGEAEAKRIALEGEAEAVVLQQKVDSYGSAQLFALSLVARHLAQSRQPLVPQHLFVTGQGRENGAAKPEQGLVGTLIELLVADKTGFTPNGNGERSVGPEVLATKR